MKWVPRLYIIFVGIILSLTVGFGISAFAPEPQYPEYPYSAKPMPQRCYEATSSSTAECQKLSDAQTEADEKNRLAHEEEMKAYKKVASGYTRNTIFLGVAIGSLFAMAGLFMIKSSRLVASGLLLAGVLTAIFTRLLISLASIGVTELTQEATTFAYIEFVIMIILSSAILIIGFRLKEEL